MGVFVINPHTGLLVRGNLDLTRRPIVRNKDGTISTVRSSSTEFNRGDAPRLIPWGKIPPRLAHVEVLFPETYDDKNHSFQSAVRHAISTGQHLGIFDTAGHATAYAIALHNWQAKYYFTKLKPKMKRR